MRAIGESFGVTPPRMRRAGLVGATSGRPPVRMTPPCAAADPVDGKPCRYPLVRSDRQCPRCGAAVPWAADGEAA